MFSDTALEKCKPVLFLAVFVDNLSVSFLPQLIRTSSEIDQAPAIMASVAFMAHFLFFAAVLIPAGKIAPRIGPKLLLCIGALSVALGLGLLVTTESLALIVLSRVFSGLGQGILFIGVQLLVLTLTKATSSQNQANGIIVYNFNAGMLSGMAIGSLLNLYMGSQGVFIFGFIVILLLAIYIYTLVPKISISNVSGHEKSYASLWKILRDFEFLRVIFLIGIPTKAVMTGVIIFGLPIIMSNLGYESDEIGQSIMFYAVGVLLSNHLVNTGPGKKFKPKSIMNAGMLIGSSGLALIGIFGLLSTEWLSAHKLTVMLMVLLGALVIGLGHGAINAPVVTYIANSTVSERSGVTRTTTLYRLLERAGHILGPMLMGQLLILTGQSAMTLFWIAIVMLIFIIFFMTDFGLKK
jgi:MFS family permease